MWIKTLGLLAVLFAPPFLAATGEDWVAVASGTDEDLHDVQFSNSQHGWILGYGNGLVLHTLDGGVTWRESARLQPIFYEQLQFLDSSRGYICGEYGSVLRSDDGGASWLEVHPPVEGLIREPRDDDDVSAEGIRALYYAMHFTDRDEGFVAGLLLDRAKRKSQTVLFRTENAGESWTRAQTPGKDFLYEVQMLAGGQEGKAIGRRIHSTEDGGLTWATVGEALEAVQARGLFFIDAEEGWSCSFDGKVLHTRDGGKQWSIEQLTTNRLRSIAFLDRQRGFAVGDGNEQPSAIWTTRDGGETWKALELAVPDLHRLTLSREALWAVGKQGKLLRLARP